MIKSGANVNHTDSDGYTILLTAILNKCQIDQIQLLVCAGADINYFNMLGQNALTVAINTNQLDIIKYLLDTGIVYDYSDKLGHTPIGLCVKNNLINVIEHIIKLGIDLNSDAVLNPNSILNKTLIQLAIDTHNEQLVIYLVNRGANVNLIRNGMTPMVYALTENNNKMFDTLLLCGANVCINASEFVSPISVAIQNHNRYAVQILLDLGVRTLIAYNVNGSVYEYSLLMYAIVLRVPKKIFRLLLDAKPDINFRSANGETALSLAVLYVNHIHIVWDLLQAGCDYTQIDFDTWSAYLHVAKNESYCSTADKIQRLIFAPTNQNI